MRTRSRELILGLTPILLGLELLGTLIYVPVALGGRADFRQFYIGCYMIRTKQPLYDFSRQKQLEDSLISAADGFLAANHPAIEYLVFAPLSLMSYRHAYITFALFNGILLVICFALLRNDVRDDWLLGCSFVGCVAVAFTLWQGQDSILLLLLFVLGWHYKEVMLSGFLLGLGAFKPQLVLPVFVLYLLWRRWRFVLGFAISAAMMALSSILIAGVRESAVYLKSLIASEQVFPRAMPNLRGLIEMCGGGFWFLAVLSLLFLYVCYRMGPSLEVAIYASLLLGFHTLAHDLTLLIIPITLHRRWASFLSPAIGLIPGYTFLAGIVILVDMLHFAKRSRNELILASKPAVAV